MDFAKLMATGMLVLAALLFFIQLYLSTRRSVVWGLLTPLGFAVMWLVVQKQPDVISFLGMTESTIDGCLRVARLGLLLSAVEFLLARLLYAARHSALARSRDRRVQEKEQRRQKEAELLGRSAKPTEKSPVTPPAFAGAAFPEPLPRHAAPQPKAKSAAKAPAPSALCPRCGAKQDGENEFCIICGQPLTVAAAAEAERTIQ